jgi:hypothetical protein
MQQVSTRRNDSSDEVGLASEVNATRCPPGVGNSSDICQGQPDNSTLTMVIYREASFMMRNSFEAGAIRG